MLKTHNIFELFEKILNVYGRVLDYMTHSAVAWRIAFWVSDAVTVETTNLVFRVI